MKLNLYTHTILCALAIILSWSCFLPLLVWWQIPLSVPGFIACHFLLLFTVFNSKLRFRLLLLLLLSGSILSFYCLNWASSLEKVTETKSLSLSLDEQRSDVVISSEPINFNVNPEILSRVGDSIYSLNQAFGKVAIGRFKTIDEKVFSLAFVETDKLFSKVGWVKNRIFLRRVTSVLRQRQEPVVVVLKSKLPAGSSVVNTFMFQARLESKAALSPWKSLLGLENYLLLGRGVRFGRGEKAGEIRFVFEEGN